ncbi:unnamed protein product, partial [Timema podura]|nr:unnamed protein product [Timema podura]
VYLKIVNDGIFGIVCLRLDNSKTLLPLVTFCSVLPVELLLQIFSIVSSRFVVSKWNGRRRDGGRTSPGRPKGSNKT